MRYIQERPTFYSDRPCSRKQAIVIAEYYAHIPVFAEILRLGVALDIESVLRFVAEHGKSDPRLYSFCDFILSDVSLY